MKIFIATLATETNTFAPLPTGLTAFKQKEYFRHDGSRHPPRIGNIPLIEWRRLAEAEGHEVAESISTFAQPGGITLRSTYEHLRGELLEDLEAAMPVDVVLLFLHGAMVADGYDDCEGDVIAHVREVVGPKAIVGVELDLHCHLTETMRTKADALVVFKEYPHTDIGIRAPELYRICVDAAEGAPRPVTVYADCRMVSMWRTSFPPMRAFVERMTSFEGRDGVLNVALGHGFPWGDVAEVGAQTVVVGEDEAKASALARQLADEFFALRETTDTPFDTIDEAIDRAGTGPSEGPIVLADVADNAGAGASSDSTFILRRLVERGARDVATGLYWDPVAVSICHEAGLGATFDLRIGGKIGPASGQPVDLRITVRGLSDEHSQFGLSGGRQPLGPAAWVEHEGIHIVLVSIRQQAFAPDGFTGLGLTLADKRLVVVKSMQHFYAAFAPIAREVRYVSAPGAVPPDYASIPFTKRTKPFWPKVADPFAGSNDPETVR
ncbi:M81 family metallopeptidase [Enterovirga rhinocerotis]|uniref:Microcystinase C n=1 Tax=Enterovirga rhinocerotis TaxID=1339210 RepID=A0A4R7BTV6_9HYPH|nr:M81 family metallopeptidase [Enterovirga rhinocerotis]TDR89194.1 microcystin degradation protein MlrC [Enterovirga rhinocerotis]